MHVLTSLAVCTMCVCAPSPPPVCAPQQPYDYGEGDLMLELRHNGADADAARLPLDAYTCASSSSSSACGAYYSDDPSSDTGAATSTALVVAVSYLV